MKAEATTEYLRECVEIDDLVLDEEFIRLPADMAYWSAQYAEAVRVYLRAKVEADATTARLHLTIKARSELEGTKMTVADLDASVKNSAEWMEAQVNLLDADATKQRLRGALDAIHAKKDMIQSLGAKLRAEMGADPMVRVEQRNKR